VHHLHRCVDLLGMKLAGPTSLYQLDGVQDSCRPVKAVSEGFTNQHVGRCMVVILASMNLYKQLTALRPGYASH
jgi:hypothetical protein